MSWQDFLQNVHILRAKCNGFWTSNLSFFRPVCRYHELWKTDSKCFNSVTQNQDAHYQQLLLKIWAENTLKKPAKIVTLKSSWELVLRPVISCSIYEQHDQHHVSSRPWRMLHNLLNFLQAEKGCPAFRMPSTLRKGGYSLRKDLCLLCSTLKHIIVNILSPVWSKLSNCWVEPWEDESEQSASAVSCHLLVLVCLFHTVQSNNVTPSVFSVLLWLRMIQSRPFLVWFYQIVSTHENHR